MVWTCGETGFVAGTASLPNTHYLLLWNPPELFAREKGLRGHVIVHPGAETWNPTADSYGHTTSIRRWRLSNAPPVPNAKRCGSDMQSNTCTGIL